MSALINSSKVAEVMVHPVLSLEHYSSSCPLFESLKKAGEMGIWGVGEVEGTSTFIRNSI